ncbi:NAD(P)H-binding protein [Dactylosporangium vinaceum]|uniref:NAD(P)-dependent oxidoreductase n=1 Tax=Dactylosporangium vinaceum TaxID=53362 RepID=A0ABV5M8J3_9ACTN|nr:NAD(P)H-binding protein [Dactylosporangium vinaceum]UAB94580.1 NAD(P)H-binding protein [Dactylosporangium vinaceum]
MNSVVVFGAGGRAGRAILAEAQRRGVAATAVVRDVAKYPDVPTAVAGDATDAEAVAAVAQGHTAAIVAVYAAEVGPADHVRNAEALLAGLERAGVHKLLLVGLATTLRAGPDAPRIFEAEGFNAEWLAFSQGRAGELAVLERYSGAVDWVVVTPPMALVEGDDPGYRVQDLGGPLTYAGLANALLEEVAADRHHRVQVGVSGQEGYTDF